MKQNLYWLLCGLSLQAFAQTNINYCDQPPAGTSVGGFTVNGTNGTVRGCAPFRVTLQSTLAISVKYIYDYRGGDPTVAGVTLEDRTEHTYLRQGTYRILQLGSGTAANGGTGSVACRTVEVYLPPNFQVRACSGRRVQVTIPSDTTTQRYDSYIVDWGDGVTTPVAKNGTNPVVTSRVFPTTINVANVVVSGVAGGQTLNCGTRRPVNISNTNLSEASVRRVTVRSDGLVDVLVRGVRGFTADLQWREGNATNFQNTGQSTSIADTTTLTIRNIDAFRNTYCFRLSSNDGCENATASSNEVCSSSLEVEAQNRQNVLTWREYPIATGFQNYRFTKNSAAFTPTETNRSTTRRNDTNVQCGEQYCYRMTVVLEGGVESVSSLRCVRAISDLTPSVVQNAFVSVLREEQKIEVRATRPNSGTTPTFKMIVTRADNGSNNFVEIATQNNTLIYKDENADPSQKSYCYQIQYENACGNRSQPTTPLCSVHLHSRTSNTVDWTSETPFQVPVTRYDLEIFNEQGTQIDFRPLGGNTSFNPDTYNPDQQLFTYRITARHATGLSYSNFFVFKRNAAIFLPDAFSPNDDRINDNFGLVGQFVEKATMVIFNRWGQVVFSSTNAKEGWNGKINEQPAPEGTYVYKVEGSDSLGKPFVKTGTVLLIR
ncbi:MAG: gliding motility-associated C-terminal domain-containing protein [Runella sp.]